jgi:thioesterase domain-containing protein
MAALYLNAVREVQPEGPYRIGGYSFGVYVAYEMARQLERDGQDVARLVLMDAPVIGETEGACSPYFLFVQWLGMKLEETALSRLPLREQATKIALAAAREMMLPPDIAETRRQLGVYEAHVRSLLSYRAGPYGGRITLLRAMQRVAGSSAAASPLYGWDRLSPEPVEVHDVPGTHFNIIFEPHVRQLGAVLRRILDETPAR